MSEQIEAVKPVFNKLDKYYAQVIAKYLHKIKHEIFMIQFLLNQYEKYCNDLRFPFCTNSFKCFYISRLYPIKYEDLILFERQFRKMSDDNDMYKMKVMAFDYVICESQDEITFMFNSDVEAIHTFIRGHNLYVPRQERKKPQEENYGYTEAFVQELLNSK